MTPLLDVLRLGAVPRLTRDRLCGPCTEIQIHDGRRPPVA